MKRLLLFVALAVVATAAVPVLAGAAPKFEKANGTGQSAAYGSVHVNAKDQGDGPRGHFFIDQLQFDVTCIRQQGNTALIGGLDRATGTMPVLVEVRDNGQPGAGADQHRWRPAPENGGIAPPDCGDFGNNPPPATIEQGNYVVPSGDGG
jgi:hypothetical protein